MQDPRGGPRAEGGDYARIFIAMRWYDAQNQFRTMEADFVTAYWQERRRSKSRLRVWRRNVSMFNAGMSLLHGELCSRSNDSKTISLRIELYVKCVCIFSAL
jgi:hypothetical protein